ncbi:MAG: hypothetical protein WA354_19190 [Terracidiphilus sp.]
MKGIFLTRLSIFAVAALMSTPFCSAQANLAGDWQGSFDQNGITFQLAWHVTVAADGTLTSTLDNVTQSIFGIKAKKTTVKGSEVKIEVDDVISPNGQDINLKGSFVGTLNKEANEVSGTWTQIDPPQDPIQITFKHSQSQPAPAAPAMAQPSVAGDWAGTLTAGPAQLRLVLHITAAKDGTLTGTLDSLDQGAIGIPVSSIELRGSQLTLGLPAVSGTYAGTVNKDSSEIGGTWSQGQPLTLNFKRAQPQTAAPAPKSAVPSDIDGTWQGALDTPKGTLRILFKIVNMDTGLTATVQSPDQSPAWAPTTSVTRTGNKISIEMKAFGATFEGQINAAKDTIDGSFTQGMSIPLVLKKS